MSYFITGCLPIHNYESNANSIQKIFNEKGFSFSTIKNREHIKGIGDKYKFFRFTDFVHDNDLLIGYSQINKVDTSKLRSKLKKKKWSESKIDRFIIDKLQLLEKKFIERNPWAEDFKGSFLRWYELFESLFKAFNVKEVGIIYHWYSSTIDSEQISKFKERKIKLENMSSDILQDLLEDEILFIKK